ncbi:hypothetical protein LEP1GSC060_0445 [Leptospira weilii serovar Ranarum str. ICFT]|uniref:Uncharacterized protein n=1 Tax=Leptospira weilii serovar Ranarum str. ICFT TaxID=1218598 RepID=N1WV17_9LEPT|nr:hypothetical protein LEP1GSC060_0445 [Leptospira weilii serovar Ranarum str. ICFT]
MIGESEYVFQKIEFSNLRIFYLLKSINSQILKFSTEFIFNLSSGYQILELLKN